VDEARRQIHWLNGNYLVGDKLLAVRPSYDGQSDLVKARDVSDLITLIESLERLSLVLQHRSHPDLAVFAGAKTVKQLGPLPFFDKGLGVPSRRPDLLGHKLFNGVAHLTSPLKVIGLLIYSCQLGHPVGVVVVLRPTLG
jgi:hypothetical protein